MNFGIARSSFSANTRSGIETQSMQNYLNNFALGSTLKANTTIFNIMLVIMTAVK